MKCPSCDCFQVNLRRPHIRKKTVRDFIYVTRSDIFDRIFCQPLYFPPLWRHRLVSFFHTGGQELPKLDSWQSAEVALRPADKRCRARGDGGCDGRGRDGAPRAGRTSPQGDVRRRRNAEWLSGGDMSVKRSHVTDFLLGRYKSVEGREKVVACGHKIATCCSCNSLSINLSN